MYLAVYSEHRGVSDQRSSLSHFQLQIRHIHGTIHFCPVFSRCLMFATLDRLLTCPLFHANLFDTQVFQYTSIQINIFPKVPTWKGWRRMICRIVACRWRVVACRWHISLFPLNICGLVIVAMLLSFVLYLGDAPGFRATSFLCFPTIPCHSASQYWVCKLIGPLMILRSRTILATLIAWCVMTCNCGCT